MLHCIPTTSKTKSKPKERKIYSLYHFIILTRSHLFIWVFSDDNDSPTTQVEINFLHYVSRGYWEFPKKVDEKLVDIKFVFTGPVTPKSITRGGYTFQEDPNSLEIYKMLRNKNKK